MKDDTIFSQDEIVITNTDTGKIIRFIIWHNLKKEENVNTIESAVENWSLRTKHLTAKSLCNYINSKREKGLSNDYAFTDSQFKTYKKEFLQLND